MDVEDEKEAFEFVEYFIEYTLHEHFNRLSHNTQKEIKGKGRAHTRMGRNLLEAQISIFTFISSLSQIFIWFYCVHIDDSETAEAFCVEDKKFTLMCSRSCVSFFKLTLAAALGSFTYSHVSVPSRQIELNFPFSL